MLCSVSTEKFSENKKRKLLSIVEKRAKIKFSSTLLKDVQQAGQ